MLSSLMHLEWSGFLCSVIIVDLFGFFYMHLSNLTSTICWRFCLFSCVYFWLYKNSSVHRCIDLCLGLQLDSIDLYLFLCQYLVFFPLLYLCSKVWNLVIPLIMGMGDLLLMPFSISFFSVLKFLLYKSFISLVRTTPIYLFFEAIVKGIVSLISSSISFSLVYRKTTGLILQFFILLLFWSVMYDYYHFIDE